MAAVPFPGQEWQLFVDARALCRLQASMLALANLCVQGPGFLGADLAVVLVARLRAMPIAAMPIAASGHGGELATLVLGILVKMNIAQVHVPIVRCN